ncbi:MAG: hypothetical protein HY738_05715 [Bacteroidia bacterium]|nr:hypothetical protein [Bacteroidia bacterium]
MTWEYPTGSFYGDNRAPLGNPLPKFVGGITNTFSYRNFDLSFLFSFISGSTIYDDQAKKQIGMWKTDSQRPEILNAWTPENSDSDIPALSKYGADATSPYVNSDRFLYDGSFIRLKSLSLGYSVSKELCKKLHLNNLRIYIAGTNLLTFTKYPGWDPEVLRDTSPRDPDSNISFAAPSYATPQARVFNAGIQVEF